MVTVPPGSSPVGIDLDHLAVSPGTPIVVIVESHPDVSWSRTWQEPPGTQAARWDDDLGYWRWEHGTLGFALDPVSTPYGPENALSGVTRPEIGANVWISDPNQPLPQAWELHWPQPQTVETIELTFDSQLSGWIWEGAFPLIPRAWDLQVLKAGSPDWLTIDGREHNAQRRAIHQFPAEKLDAVRITVRATQGGRTARIVEVRIYGPDASASTRGRAT